MAKYDMKEVKKAIDYIQKVGPDAEVNINIGPYDRLTLTFDSADTSDVITITVYPTEHSKFAEVTKTERL